MLKFLSEVFLHDCHNCSLNVHRNILWRRLFLKKKLLFSKIVSKLKLGYFFGLLAIKNQQVSRNRDLSSQRNDLRKKKLNQKIENSFSFQTQKLFDSGKTLSASLSKLRLSYPEDHFGEEYVLWKKYNNQDFYKFWSNFFSKVRLAFFNSVVTSTFSIFSGSCQRKHFFFEKYCSIYEFLELCGRIFRTSWWTFSVGLSKLHSTCLEVFAVEIFFVLFGITVSE